MNRTERKLASIQKVIDKKDIPGADNIELVYVLGWQCVARKNEFAIGDLCVYFEIDSLLPTHEVFSFMAPRKYRVKTVKLMKQVSQGLALPISIMDNFKHKKKLVEGVDVTQDIGVIKYDPRPQNSNPRTSNKNRSPVMRFLMGFAPFRILYKFVMPKKSKGNFPDFIPKTNEVRLQSEPHILVKCRGKRAYCTEKLDGSSATFFYNFDLVGKKFGIFEIDPGDGFGVCSRNLRLLHNDNSIWWRVAIQQNMRTKLETICKILNKSLAIQGEIIGPNVQSNKYNLKGLDFYCFNIYDISDKRYLSLEEKENICKDIDIKTVPIVRENIIITKTKDVNWFLEVADRVSSINNAIAEGIVTRLKEDDSTSFKVINSKWLLKHKE